MGANALCRRGRSVTSLGVLYDFTGNSVNTTVQEVQDMVKDDWVCFSLSTLLRSV